MKGDLLPRFVVYPSAFILHPFLNDAFALYLDGEDQGRASALAH
jgi:hypothetical protein